MTAGFRSKTHPSWWESNTLPVVFLVFALSVLVGLWWVYDRAERRQSSFEARLTVEQVRLRLEAWIGTRTTVMEHMASVWMREYQGRTEEYHALATHMLDLFPGFQALNWIDRDWRIRIVVPEASVKRTSESRGEFNRRAETSATTARPALPSNRNTSTSPAFDTHPLTILGSLTA